MTPYVRFPPDNCTTVMSPRFLLVLFFWMLAPDGYFSRAGCWVRLNFPLFIRNQPFFLTSDFTCKQRLHTCVGSKKSELRMNWFCSQGSIFLSLAVTHNFLFVQRYGAISLPPVVIHLWLVKIGITADITHFTHINLIFINCQFPVHL